MDSLITSATNIPISLKTTVEDVLNFSKAEIQAFLRVNNLKISGDKLTLAKRIVDTISSRCSAANDITCKSTIESTESSSADLPDISELQSGWTGNSFLFPKVTISDIEKYLLYSSHRTEDAAKMQCYRQYIRGLNFYKEGYIHKVMINCICDNSKHSYIRSKCFPSMQQGVYEQWILVTNESPFEVVKAYCTCPAGLGEGCTHIAGLLFALEGRPPVDELEDLPCTSKPCQWNQPSKKKKDSRPVKDICFKRVRYEDSLRVKGKKTAKYSVDSISFRDSLCAKLGNNSRAVLFDIIPPAQDNSCDVESDLNISNFEEVETSTHIVHESDRFIDIVSTVKNENITEPNFQEFVSTCSENIINEIEVRTKGQHENPLWGLARKARITASLFHDIKTKKDQTKPDNIIQKVLGDSKPFDNSAVAWGRKQETVAKKRYIAYKKLKENKKVQISDMGLVLCNDISYIGASPDGLVSFDSDQYLIEVKCPYKWRNSKLTEACKNKEFCCYLDDNCNIQLKKNHRYYTQVQGQMGVCKIQKCDFAIYTVNDFAIITVHFDKLFWESLLQQLKEFYLSEIIPKICC